jgi:antitoxin HicB
VNHSSGRNISEFATLDDLLEEQGFLEDVSIAAMKRIVALQLEQAMRDQCLSKTAMAQRMGTSRAQLDRVLDPDSFNVTLETLVKATRAVGARLTLSIA